MSETKTLNLKRDYGKKVIPLAQFKEMNGDYDETEFNNYKSLYEKTLTTISQGEIVKGKILAISEKEVKVDIG
ncbi:30S ribosomal protein S1, partial [bacterium]|nr:30S ribosomal protein S1 [bacterium]